VKKVTRLTALAAASIAALALLTGCPKPGHKDPCKPGGCQVNGPVTEKGDGIWSVGDEIEPGLWQLDNAWKDTEKYPNCAWFVSPAADPAPSASPSNEPTSTRARVETPGSVTIRLHVGEHLTSSDCPNWKKVGD